MASRSISSAKANDYVGKGLSGGRIIVRPPAELGHRAGEVDHRRQHGAVRRHLRRVLFPRHRRRALRRAQLRRHRRGRGHRRPWLRIHDRRRGGGDRADGAQFRRRHVGRHRLRARRGRRLRAALQPRHGRSRAGAERERGHGAEPPPDRRSRKPRPGRCRPT